MKKLSILCFALALIMAACDDDSDTQNNTNTGDNQGNQGQGGNEQGNQGQGGNEQGNQGQGGDTSQNCAVTFKYVNIDTCAATGGTQDWDVYLTGSMNNWDKTNASYKMNADEACVRTLQINAKVGDKYKFYVNGWGDTDSYRSDSNACADEDCNNAISATQCGQTIEFIEKACGEQGCGNNGGNDHPTDETCQVTFTYFNQWTNVCSGGADNWDVYLVGSMNDWKEADEAFKMTSDGKGTHSITVTLQKGETYEYKYFVNGWDKDSWKTDAEDGASNGIAVISSCDVSFGHGNPDPSGFNCAPDTPKPEPTDCETTFVYVNKYTNVASGGTADFDVYLVGDMNDWTPGDANFKMTSDNRGTHTYVLKSPKNASYKYKFYVNGWEGDSWRANPYDSANLDGNSIANITTCGQTFQFIDVPVDGDATIIVPPTPDGSITLKSQPKVDRQSEYQAQISIELLVKEGITIESATCDMAICREVNINNEQQTLSIFLDSRSGTDGKYVITVKGSDGSELYIPVWVEAKPFDWHDALLYFAFTDRFANGDTSNDNPKTTATVEGSSNAQWMGGDFKGLLDKVKEGYFDALGVNTLWISSVSMNAQGTSQGTNGDEAHWYSAYHSYWPISSFMTSSNQSTFNSAGIQAIEPHFGTLEELKTLVDECHKRGIRVLVDFAANHVHKDSPIVASHPDWFNGNSSNAWICDSNNGWDRAPETCWFSADLPDINYNHAEARKAMVDHAIWLIKQTNIDGFRVDAVKHMAVQFIKDLRAATDKLFANTGITFYMVGETFTGDVALLNKYIGNDLLHAQFDFPMYYAIKNHILGLGNYAEVANLQNHFNSNLMGTFMGNHDVARAISVAANQNQNKWGQNAELTDWQPYLKVKTALTILLTNPGVPLIYYGDEYGMEGANDPDNRRMMEFGDSLNEQQKMMLDYVQKLGKIRASYPAITRGKRENLSVGGSYWCYKISASDQSSIIVGVSREDGFEKGGICDLKGNYNLVNLLDDAHSERSGVTHLDLNTDHLQIYLVK